MQQQAAREVLLPFLEGDGDHPFAVLEGSAGSGKSYLVAALLRELALSRPSARVAVTAPTNKAVRVLKSMLEAAGVPVVEAGDSDEFGRGARMRARTRRPGVICKSVHSVLGLRMKELQDGRQEARKEGESTLADFAVCVVDEASMIGDDLFGRIRREMGECRVLFVGDPAQLPPVDAATRALSPVFDGVSLVVRMSEIVRQAADNPIIKLSVYLRRCIERAERPMLAGVRDALGDGVNGAGNCKAALVNDNPAEMLLDAMEAMPGRDIRIVAYTNARVRSHNERIHLVLHGDELPFCEGERVIMQQQHEALNLEADERRRLITSEELTVLECAPEAHPRYPDVPAHRLDLEADDGTAYRVWVADDESLLSREVDGLFSRWRATRDAAERSNGYDRDRLKSEASEWSGKAWAMRRGFADVRHAYAITAHKAQGSTFDCAIVDWSDLSRMRDAAEFSRCLYVAVTRSRDFLAVVA